MGYGRDGDFALALLHIHHFNIVVSFLFFVSCSLVHVPQIEFGERRPDQRYGFTPDREAVCYAECEKQARQWQRKNMQNHRVSKLTLELVQILLTLRAVARVAHELVALRPAVPRYSWSSSMLTPSSSRMHITSRTVMSSLPACWVYWERVVARRTR